MRNWFLFPLLSICLLISSSVEVVAQEVVDSFDVAFNKQYQQNIKKERINGVYIPKDLEDAFIELERLSDMEAVMKFRNAPEEVVARKLHFGLGKWMVVNWNFYDGSRFSHYLRTMGISHPDDMAQFTIVSWHRHLNGRDLEMKERAAKYESYRKGVSGVDTTGKNNNLVPVRKDSGN